MARMGSGGSGAPGKPTKIVKRATPPPPVHRFEGGAAPSGPPKQVVRKTTTRSDVQSSGGDYGTKKATAYQRTPAARKPVVVASPVIVRDSQTGKPHTVVVKQPYTRLHTQALIPGVNLKSVAAYLNGNPYTGRDPGLKTDLGHAADTVGKGVVYAGETARNVIRRSQGPPTSVQQAGFVPDPGGKVAENLPVDFANTMVNAIPSTAHLVSEAAHGHPGRALKQLAAPYVQTFKDPVGSLENHPFSTTMLFTGPVRGVSRGVGALARRGAFGDAAKAAASTDRAPAVVEHTKLVHPRRYSPDPVGKAVQVATEKGKLPITPKGIAARKAIKLQRKADQAAAAGNHADAAALRDQAARANPTRMHEDQVKRRVDEIRDVNEVVRRRHGQHVSSEVHAAVRNRPAIGRFRVRKAEGEVKPTAAVSLVAQKITYPTVDDLRAYQAELEHQHAHGDLTAAQRATNEQLRGQIQGALDHPQDMGRVQQAANRYLAVERPITQQLEQHRILEPGETAKRRELPFATRHLGATRDSTPRLTRAGTARLVLKEQRGAQAQRVVRAEKAVTSTRQALDKAQIDLAQRGRTVSEQRSVPHTTVLGRKGKATGGKGVRDMLAWMNKVEQRDPTVVRPARGKSAPLSPADRLRSAITTHDTAKTILAREKAAAIELRRKAKTLRKTTAGSPNKQAPGWVDEHGRPLTARQMRTEREQGSVDAVTGRTTRTPLPGEAAYVSHAPTLNRPGSFYRDSARPVDAGNKHFTGGSVTKGTLDASEEAMHASARRLQSLLDAHEGHVAFLDETAMRDANGKVVNGDRTRVQAAIDRNTLDKRGHPLPGARKWRVVRTNPFGGRQGQLDELLHSLNEHGESHSNIPGSQNPVVGAVEDALAGKGDGPFVAIPEEAAVQLERHLQQLGRHTGQVFNVLSSLWRKNVLAFSPKWAASNIGEATERSLVAGVRPGDRALMSKTLAAWKQDNPAEYERFLASIGTGHYGMSGRNQRYATRAEFSDPTRNGPFVRSMARLAGTVQRTPVVHWLPKVYGEWTRTVMEDMGRVESQFKVAMAGKKLRDLTQNSRAFADLSEKGVREALHGLRDTKTQIEIARFVRDAYGQYEAFSPEQQAWIKTYTPFYAWARNAAKFLAVTLPRDHPVVTALASDLTRSQEKWLRDTGLWLGQIDSLPSYMLGDVPTASGGLLKVARYTPQSLLADPLGTLAGLVLPQGENITMAARGLDPFGKPLRGGVVPAILKSFLGLVIPGPLAPKTTGSSSLLDTLNPVQVIPASKVKYARAKATFDRVSQQINQLPPAAKVKGKDGSYQPTYRKLLDQRSALAWQKHVLLVQSGYVKDPALGVEQQLKALHAKADPLKAQTDRYGFHTKEYTQLANQISVLEKERRALLKQGAKPKKLVRARPLSSREQVRKEIADLHKQDVRKQIRDEINRLHEQEQVNSGG